MAWPVFRGPGARLACLCTDRDGDQRNVVGTDSVCQRTAVTRSGRDERHQPTPLQISHAAEPDVSRRAVLRLRRARRRPVPVAVLRRAQMRSALEGLVDGRIGASAPACSSPWAAVEPVVGRELGRRPLPHVADHVDQAEPVGRERARPATCPIQPSAPSLRYGKRPCQVLAISRPSGVTSSPHA